MTLETTMADYIDGHLDQLADQLAASLSALPNSSYAKMDRATLAKDLRRPFEATSSDLRGDKEALIDFSRTAITQRTRNGQMTSELVGQIGDHIYATLIKTLAVVFPGDELAQARAQVAISDLTYRANKASYQAYVSVREENINQREAEMQRLQAEQDQLSTTLRELSAPIAPIHDNVLVLPLVGAIDADRAQTLNEELLERIVERQSDLVIIDITGVPLVDTNIANYLLQTTRAVGLLGAQVILVGISAEVAQTIVSLDLDLRQLTVRANLQDGIEYALAQLGLGIMPLSAEAIAARQTNDYTIS